MAIIESLSDARERVELAAVFHALADPTRLLILEHLRTGEHRVKDLTEHLGLAQSTVSAHLACLRDGGLISARSQGRASYFSLVDEQRIARLLAEAGAAAQPRGHQWHEHHIEHAEGS
ncbi:hypothetical protein GCM10027417_20080 [Glutamicibacter endophyticus]|uniref:ArsR/SmtB family transcription factor n=1 Tax=Glutamicibacter sp. PS TaxID=3075634 RepID=UPI00284C0AA9|nr:metalloregulator ArsR/SmtB family transcription factor [Glutamicibacter sp. PS]MDR4533799.1 metalloregulator ArsR/SmtB family transcription factor [Glutamicibacter sp. PS]